MIGPSLRRGRLLTAWLLIACCCPVAAADVRARVEPRVIDELETTRLILRAGGTTQSNLDLAPLEQDFEVLGTQTASQYQSLGGVIEAWVEYQVTLRPRRAGTLAVPSLKVGDAVSPPVELVVRPIDPALRDAIDRMVFFEQTFSRDPVYVGSETIMVRRLYYSSATQIYSDLPGTPEIPGALVLPVGETRTGSVPRDGETYGVLEQRFAIFPGSSGTLTVPSTSLTTSVRLQEAGRVRRTGVRVATGTRELTVLPVPAEYPSDRPWLPASAVDIRERWQPADDALGVGEPVERELDIVVTGNLAAAIPPPDDELPASHFRQYPEPAVLNDDRGGTTVTGRRRTRYAILPTAPGSVRLPDVAITWWNVDAARVEVARLEGRSVTLTGGNAAPAAGTDATAAQRASTAEPVQPDPTPARPTEPLLAYLGRYLPALGFMAAALAAGAALFSLLRVPAVHARLTGALGRITPAPRRALARAARSLERRRQRRTCLARCRGGDPGPVHAALAAFLAAHFDTSAADALQRFRACGHAALLDELNAARYARNPPARYDGAALAAALRALPAPRPRRAAALPALYAPDAG